MAKEKIGQVGQHMINSLRNEIIFKRVLGVRFLSIQEANELGWSNRPVVITLEDGIEFIPACDEEGNEAGVLFTNVKGAEVAFCI